MEIMKYYLRSEVYFETEVVQFRERRAFVFWVSMRIYVFIYLFNTLEENDVE